MQTKLMLLSLAFFGSMIAGCMQDTSPVAVTGTDEELANSSEPSVSQMMAGRNLVELPDGSVDGLADAIAAAGTGGVVLVKSGTHTESGTVEITHWVTILGEPGAELIVSTTPDGLLLDPGLWVHGAGRVVIRGLKITPDGAAGNCGILVQDSPFVVISNNTITDFNSPVTVEKGDRCRILKNTIDGAASEAPEIFTTGISIINGKHVLVDGNDVQDCNFGIWACDENGRATNNICHDNAPLGIICCRVPAGVLLPDGSSTGAELPCTNWEVRGNDCSDNESWGIMVVDGSADNQLVQNFGSGNGLYDIYLVGESFLFGFCTPTGINSRVISTRFPDMIIADDAEGSIILGGTLVEDPLHVPCE